MIGRGGVGGREGVQRGKVGGDEGGGGMTKHGRERGRAQGQRRQTNSSHIVSHSGRVLSASTITEIRAQAPEYCSIGVLFLLPLVGLWQPIELFAGRVVKFGTLIEDSPTLLIVSLESLTQTL